jgi:hypothetical protein
MASHVQAAVEPASPGEERDEAEAIFANTGHVCHLTCPKP